MSTTQTMTQTIPKRLAGALLAAQQAVRAAPQEGRGKFGDYVTYADAAQTARTALHGAGLVLLPSGGEVIWIASGEAREGVDRGTGEVQRRELSGCWILRRVWTLMHPESGEATVLTHAWPIVHHRGKELDLACAASRSLALKSLLEDLLLFPRGEDREDSEETTPARQPERPPARPDRPTPAPAGARAAQAAAPATRDPVELRQLGWNPQPQEDGHEPVTAEEVAVAAAQSGVIDGGFLRDATETAAKLVGRGVALETWALVGARKGAVTGVQLWDWARRVAAVATEKSNKQEEVHA
jgi:hypothetical protein